MPAVDVLDDTFVRADPEQVRTATRTRWEGWLPDLSLVVAEDRGVKGVRWLATPTGTAGPGAVGLHGTAEVWLEAVELEAVQREAVQREAVQREAVQREAVQPGTVVHLFVRLDLPPGGTVDRHARRLPDRVRRGWKRGLHRSKDVLEGEWQR